MISINLQLEMAKKRIRTIKEVADGTGLSRTTLGSLLHENGKGIQFETLNTLCEFFDCTPGCLLKYEKES